MSSESALPAGFTLQEYRIESTLGVGGFGYTYLATDANLKLQVAIKEYLPGELAERAGDHSVTAKKNEADSFKWGLQRFIDESRTLASFRHPNIVRVMRFFEANQTAYMVMEFVNGQPLPEWMARYRPLEEPMVRAIVLPLLDGLEVIHKSGYLHRDIKPANVYMREDNTPVLLDFGSARMLDTKSELTAIVSPGYAPMEQYFSGGKQGAWTDIYAFGGVMYWMLTGNKPVEAAARMRSDPMPRASEALAGKYSSALLDAVDWALMPAEEKRPQTVAEFEAAIDGRRPTDFDKTADMTALLPKAAAPVEPQPVSAALSVPSALAIDRETVKKMEAELAKTLGPIASLVIRKAVKKASSVEQLVELLAAEIEDDKERAAFVKRFTQGDKSTPVAEPSRTVSATKLAEARFDAKVLARAEAALSKHIGAVAKVVVKRAAAKARDESELYLLIGDEIADKNERKAFIRKAISASGG